MARKKTSTAQGDLEALLERLAELDERVKKLETERSRELPVEAAPATVQVQPPVAPPVPKKEEISEETISVIAAAVAAFFGLRVRVRHVRLLGSEAWAQQGRVSIMTSRHLAIQRG
jgi:hypothetical protein